MVLLDALGFRIVIAALLLGVYAFYTGMDFYKGFFWTLLGSVPVAFGLTLVQAAAEHIWDGIRGLFGKSEEENTPFKWEKGVKSAQEHLDDFKIGFWFIPGLVLALGPIFLLFPEPAVVALLSLLGGFGLHYLGFGWFFSSSVAIVGGCILSGLKHMLVQWNRRRVA